MDPMLEAFARLKAEEQRTALLEKILRDFTVDGRSAEEFLKRFQRLNNNGTQQHPPTTPKWNSLAEMNAALKRLPKRPAPPTINPEIRKKQIEDELDIIRGVKPTPKGYKIDTGKIKALVAEYNRL